LGKVGIQELKILIVDLISTTLGNFFYCRHYQVDCIREFTFTRTYKPERFN